ncbi:Hypothetical predicted protein, partial [Paramuricea clavata]
QSENEHICIHYDRSYGITTTKCNSSDPFQRWIWTQHSQLLHAETSKCIQQGKMFPGQMYTWHLGLEECNVSETKQRWDCDANFLVKRFLRTTSQQDTMYITYENDNDNTIVAKEQAPKNWKRYQLNSKICSS